MVVRTVLGDLDPAELGVTDAHDHVFFRTPLLRGQELDDPDGAAQELRAFRELAGRSVVQRTPHGMGRRAAELARLSRETGVHIVAATGIHQAAHYDHAALEKLYPTLTQLFVDTGALDVLGVLCTGLGVPLARVILGHLNRSPDQRIHREVARAGAFIAFDGPSRANHATDWRLLDSIAALAEAGHAGQLLVGADTTTARARASTGEGPGMRFLLRVLRPRIERELGDQLAHAIFIANPARAFAADWRP